MYLSLNVLLLIIVYLVMSLLYLMVNKLSHCFKIEFLAFLYCIKIIVNVLQSLNDQLQVLHLLIQLVVFDIGNEDVNIILYILIVNWWFNAILKHAYESIKLYLKAYLVSLLLGNLSFCKLINKLVHELREPDSRTNLFIVKVVKIDLNWPQILLI